MRNAYFDLTIGSLLLDLPNSPNANLSIVVEFGPCFPDISWDTSKIQLLEVWIGVELEVARVFVDIIVCKNPRRCAWSVRILLDQCLRHGDDKAVLSKVLHTEKQLQLGELQFFLLFFGLL
jgi:hypothetical protein